MDAILHFMGICPCQVSHIDLWDILMFGATPVIGVTYLFTAAYNKVRYFLWRRRNDTDIGNDC